MAQCSSIPNWVKPTSRSSGQNFISKKDIARWDEFVVRRRQARALSEKLSKWEIRRDVFSIRMAIEHSVEERFRELATKWRHDVRSVSSTTERILHPAYQDIIGMGKSAVPLILRELELNGGHWFWALRHITHENPASPEDAGNIQRLRKAWLEWGRERQYL